MDGQATRAPEPGPVESTRGLAKSTITGVLWTGGIAGVRAVAQLLALLVLARLLTPESFGLYAATLIVTQFASSFAEMGVSPAIVQRPVLEPRHLQVGFALSVTSGLAVAALVWASAPMIAGLLGLEGLVEILRVICVIFLFRGLSLVAQASALRARRFRWLAVNDLVSFSISFLLIGTFLAWLGFGVWALVGALLAQHALRTALLIFGQPHPKRPILDWRAALELLILGGGMSLGRLFNYIAEQLDKIVVSRFLGAEALGLYSVAAQFTTTPAAQMGGVFERVLFPTLSTIQSERHRVVRAYRTALAGCTLLVLPSSVFVAIMAPEIVLVVLGDQWAEIAMPLRILMAGMVLCTNFKICDSLVKATGAVYSRAVRQALFAAAVGSGAAIGQFWGLEGVAYGVLSAFAISYFLMARLSSRLTMMPLSMFVGAHVPGITVAAVTASCTVLIAGYFRDLGAPAIIVLIAAGVLPLLPVLLLSWLMPSVFLGRDGLDTLRTLRRIVLTRRRPSAPVRIDPQSARRTTS